MNDLGDFENWDNSDKNRRQEEDFEINNSIESIAFIEQLKTSSKEIMMDLIYKAIVKNEMAKTGVQNILDLILKRYNKIPLVKKVKFDLTDYITLQTIEGIFYLIEENEKEIRKNPKARTTKMLKKIFN